MDQEKIGNYIKSLRTKNKLTQQEFGKLFGVTYQAVSKWENGMNLPDIAILREICKHFNVDINELLDSKVVKKRKIIFLVMGILVIVLLTTLCFVFLIHNDGFEFKTLNSKCNDFELSGSVAYNKDKTSLYISNIEYCGDFSDTKYKRFECKLFEKHNGDVKEISSCDSNSSNLSLNDYLKEVKIKIDDYSSICNSLDEAELYFEVQVYNDNDELVYYNIPISLDDRCE